MGIRLVLTSVGLTVAMIAGVGCQSPYANLPSYQPSTQPVSTGALTPAKTLAPVEAVVAPPSGWDAAPLENTKESAHQVWVSPSRRTAYGVIHFGMPLPLPATWLLGPFVDEMKKREGKADILGTPLKDDNLPGLRVVVETSQYKMRINLIVRGFKGWAVYAGTVRDKAELSDELGVAEKARDTTQVGAGD